MLLPMLCGFFLDLLVVALNTLLLFRFHSTCASSMLIVPSMDRLGVAGFRISRRRCHHVIGMMGRRPIHDAARIRTRTRTRTRWTVRRIMEMRRRWWHPHHHHGRDGLQRMPMRMSVGIRHGGSMVAMRRRRRWAKSSVTQGWHDDTAMIRGSKLGGVQRSGYVDLSPQAFGSLRTTIEFDR